MISSVDIVNASAAIKSSPRRFLKLTINAEERGVDYGSDHTLRERTSDCQRAVSVLCQLREGPTQP